LDFIEINQVGISEMVTASSEQIAVMDASFVAKAVTKRMVWVSSIIEVTH